MNNIFHNRPIDQYSYLVTGGAGFVGSHIAEYLLMHGGKVRVLDNLQNGFKTNIHLLEQYSGFEFIEGDIRDIETCRKACDGIDMVTHQAALGSVPRSVMEPALTNDVNVGGFVNMMKAAVEKKVKRFVYASSSSVYGDDPNLPKKEDRTGKPLSPYAVSKRVNEMYADVFADIYRIQVIGLRYFNIFGPRQDPNGPYAAVIPLIIKAIRLNTDFYINGDGEQTRDFTFVQDAVQVNIKALLTENESALNRVYNVAAGKNYTINNVFSLVKKYLGSQQEPVYREPRAGDIRNSLADITLAGEMLGYRPSVTFQDGLQQTIDHFKKIYS